MALGKIDVTHTVFGFWTAMSTSKYSHSGDTGQGPVPVLGICQVHPESEPQGPAQPESNKTKQSSRALDYRPLSVHLTTEKVPGARGTRHRS